MIFWFMFRCYLKECIISMLNKMAVMLNKCLDLPLISQINCLYRDNISACIYWGSRSSHFDQVFMSLLNTYKMHSQHKLHQRNTFDTDS